MDVYEFVIRKGEVPIVYDNLERVQDLFGVQIEIARRESISDIAVQQQLQQDAVCHDSLWIKVVPLNRGSTKGRDAKNYILSLTVEPDRCVTQSKILELAVYLALLERQDEAERDSQAVFSFAKDGLTVCMSSHSQNHVISAVKKVDEIQKQVMAKCPNRRTKLVSENTSPARQPHSGQTGAITTPTSSPSTSTSLNSSPNNAIKDARQSHLEYSQQDGMCRSTTSPGLESHDSCYDSDGSNCESQRNLDSHDSVTKTVSDTLAGELSEDPLPKRVRKRQDDLDVMEDGCSTSVPHLHEDEEDENKVTASNQSAQSIPDYTSKVEFALKLGYTEEQLITAIEKVGLKAKNNDLLTELIQLGSGSVAPEQEFGSQESLDHAQVLPRITTIRTDIVDDSTNLRPIVIDGSNVAMSHGNKKVFSCQGILLTVDWFRSRGHKDIVVFVPQWRKETPRSDTPITGQDILLQLEKEQVLVFTPARRIGGKRVVCYDDRFIIKLAAENGGIVVSNDNYRDIINEKPAYKKVIEERLLMYSFVNDRFMPPDDPLGRHGPSLENFLRKEPTVPEPLPPQCPYGKKCTYGNKCKFYHPERGSQPQRTVTEKLAEQAKVKILQAKERTTKLEGVPKIKVSSSDKGNQPGKGRQALSRTRSLASAPSEQSVVRKTSLDERRDSEAAKNYNDLLTQHRKRIEAATELEKSLKQSQENLESGQESRSVYRQSPPAKSSFASASLAPPAHWAVSHDNLHPVHSDPTWYCSQDTSGHLALAKKLSDEGKTVKKEEQPNRHNKLQRQFSLAGEFDPRFQRRAPEAVKAEGQFRSMPPGVSLGRAPMASYDPHEHHASFPMQPEMASRYAPNQHGQSLYRQSSYGGQPLTGVAPSFQHLMHEEHQNVTRMWSAPSKFPSRNTTSPKPMALLQAMNRQNSSSDSRLNSPAKHLSLWAHSTVGNEGIHGNISSWPPVQDTSNFHNVPVSYQSYPSAMSYSHAAPPSHPPRGLPTGAYPPFDLYPPQRQPQEPVEHTLTTGQISTQPISSQRPLYPSQVPPPQQPRPYHQANPPAPSTHTQPTHPSRREDAGFPPNDPRHSLYYHLSPLFGESKVRKVLLQMPNETNPNIICQEIMKIKD